MNVYQILKMPRLDDDEIIKAAAKSRKLAKVLKNARDMGLEVSVIHIPPCLPPCTGDQVDG